MKISYSWLKNYVKNLPKPEKLADLLTMHSFEVAEIKKSANDFIFDIDILPNRAHDCLSHLGVAKECAAILGYKIPAQGWSASGGKNQKVNEDPKSKVGDFIKIDVQDKDGCSRYTARVISDIKISSSPKWLKEKLENLGQKSINNVVDAANYVMLETGQPLHAFDLEKIMGGKMNVRESGDGEELTTLDGTKHKLPAGAIIIEDAKRVIDLAGIMGGENSAVSNKTKKILLQAAVFDPTRIYKASRALNFYSDASRIYAAGIDPNQSFSALNRAAGLLVEISGAKKVGAAIDIYSKKEPKRRIFFRPGYSDGLIGQKLSLNFYKDVFGRLGFGVKKIKKGFLVEIPSIRRDIRIEEDLVEEAARLFGYENIKGKVPEAGIFPSKSNDELFWADKVRDYLVSVGFSESLLYAFASERELLNCFTDPVFAPELANPLNQETKYLAPRVLIKYISSAAENLRNYDTVQIFGIAKSFEKDGGNITERKDLILAAAKRGSSGEDEFLKLKGMVEQLFEGLGISDYWYDDNIESKTKNQEFRIFHPYRLAEIKIGDDKIGNIGEIHPAVLEDIKSRGRIVVAEIDFEKLWKLASAEAEYRPVGKYPAVVRDIAVVVPHQTRTEEVLNVIENAGGNLLIDTDLFDYFQDEAMRESGEKSLAFHLIFQSPERTLKDEEVSKIIEKITAGLREKGWEIRG